MDKQPIYVDSRDLKQFGLIKKLIDEAGDYGSIDFQVNKHEGTIVSVVHTTKYTVRSKVNFDTKT